MEVESESDNMFAKRKGKGKVSKELTLPPLFNNPTLPDIKEMPGYYEISDDMPISKTTRITHVRNAKARNLLRRSNERLNQTQDARGIVYHQQRYKLRHELYQIRKQAGQLKRHALSETVVDLQGATEREWAEITREAKRQGGPYTQHVDTLSLPSDGLQRCEDALSEELRSLPPLETVVIPPVESERKEATFQYSTRRSHPQPLEGVGSQVRAKTARSLSVPNVSPAPMVQTRKPRKKRSYNCIMPTEEFKLRRARAVRFATGSIDTLRTQAEARRRRVGVTSLPDLTKLNTQLPTVTDRYVVKATGFAKLPDIESKAGETKADDEVFNETDPTMPREVPDNVTRARWKLSSDRSMGNQNTFADLVLEVKMKIKSYESQIEEGSKYNGGRRQSVGIPSHSESRSHRRSGTNQLKRLLQDRTKNMTTVEAMELDQLRSKLEAEKLDEGMDEEKT